MDNWPTALAVTIAGTVIAAIVLGALVWVSRRVSRRVTHQVRYHVELDVARMDIPHGVEAPWTFCFSGREPSAPTLPMNGNSDWWNWAHTQGGHDVAVTVLEVTLQAEGDAPIAIDPPEIDNHNAVPRSADAVAYGPEILGGNGIHTRRFLFTLRGDTVTREYMNELPPWEEDSDPLPAAFRLAKGDTERLLIVVLADDDLQHIWTIRIPIVHAGKRRWLKIRQPGRLPFVTYGHDGLRRRAWVSGWVDVP